MTTITYAQAVANLTAYHRAYNPADNERELARKIKAFDDAVAFGARFGEDLDQVYEAQVIRLIFDLAFPLGGRLAKYAKDFNDFFPLQPHQYFAALELPDLVRALQPNAGIAVLNPLQRAFDAKAITLEDIFAGWIAMGSPLHTPVSGRDIVTGIFNHGYGSLPSVDLSFPGVTQDQLAFLVSIYVGAFNRAPEHDGLAYWAGDLSRALANGTSEADAFRSLAKSMYYSGTASGESGTEGGNNAFINSVYRSVLGREADAEGRDYWQDELDRGVQTRDAFLATFLTSALGAQGDQEYLLARIEVAKFAAQAHVSGSGVKAPDLVKIMQGTQTAADAYWTITEGQALHANTRLAQLALSEDDDLFLAIETIATPDDVASPEIDVLSLIGAADEAATHVWG